MVNQAFAQAVIAEARRSGLPPLVLLLDYHLYLAPGYIKKETPNLVLEHYSSLPWPEPSYWGLLPSPMRQSIMDSLCAAEVVGMQTRRDVYNFLHCCHSFLPEAEVDYNNCRVWYKEHLTAVNAYPMSVDIANLQRIASSPRVQENERKLRSICGEQTIIRIDQANPSRNIVRGSKAFELLCERYPELQGNVKFLAFLAPSRAHLRQYERYLEEIKTLVKGINARFGNEGWQPIEVFYENNYAQAMAALKLYDVLLVNSVIDGMNLIAKEGPPNKYPGWSAGAIGVGRGL